METILLIEDNNHILENLCEYLELEGYKILVANDGKVGIELAREHLPDLIICDILMPDVNGREVLRLLLDSTETNSIPFIFSTAMSEKTDRADALLLGADDYLIKPYEMEELMKMIKSWLKSGTKRVLK